jgi:putative acetyltransferase
MIVIRPEQPEDFEAIRTVIAAAFRQTAEAVLVDQLREDGDMVLSLVAEKDGTVVGHVAFSRVRILNGQWEYPAVALAPLAVRPQDQGAGIGGQLVSTAHALLREAGERLSLVLGDPEYYGRFGYRRDLAENLDSDYQSDALQALSFDEDPPPAGELRYAFAFTEL